MGPERERDGCGVCRKDPTSLDKASLARIGMLKARGLGDSDQLRSGENDPQKSRKAKEMPDVWDKGRFVELLNKDFRSFHVKSIAKLLLSCACALLEV